MEAGEATEHLNEEKDVLEDRAGSAGPEPQVQKEELEIIEMDEEEEEV